MFFTNTLGDAQNLMRALEDFCIYTKLNANSSKMKIVLVKIQNKDKPYIMYNNELLEIVTDTPTTD